MRSRPTDAGRQRRRTIRAATAPIGKGVHPVAASASRRRRSKQRGYASCLRRQPWWTCDVRARRPVRRSRSRDVEGTPMSQPSRTAAWLSRVVILIVLAVLAGLSASIVAPRLADAQQQDQEGQAQPAGQTVNVELILDSSGSMAEQTNTGEARIEAAKRALNEVIDAIPGDRGEQINVGFRVFGHLGDNTDAGRAESCQSTELRVPIEGVNKDA